MPFNNLNPNNKFEGLFSLFYCLQPPKVLYCYAFHSGSVQFGQSCLQPYIQFAILTFLNLTYPEFTTHVVNDVTLAVTAYAT